MAAKTKRIGDSNLELAFAGNIRHIIQVAYFIRGFLIDGRRNDAATQALNQSDGFQPAGSSKRVAGHRLVGGNRNAVSRFPEQLLNRQCFRAVPDNGAGCMGADNIHFLRLDSRFAEVQASSPDKHRCLPDGWLPCDKHQSWRHNR